MLSDKWIWSLPAWCFVRMIAWVPSPQLDIPGASDQLTVTTHWPVGQIFPENSVRWTCTAFWVQKSIITKKNAGHAVIFVPHKRRWTWKGCQHLWHVFEGDWTLSIPMLFTSTRWGFDEASKSPSSPKAGHMPYSQTGSPTTQVSRVSKGSLCRSDAQNSARILASAVG